MSQLCSSGKIGVSTYLICPEEAGYNVIVNTPTQVFKTTTTRWDLAKKWVELTIRKYEAGYDEAERDY